MKAGGFSIRERGSRTASKMVTMDFRKANFTLFENLLGRIPQEEPLQGRGVQESWLIFKDKFLQGSRTTHPDAQEVRQRG